MKDLVNYIVKQIVQNKDAVTIEEESQDGNVNLLLSVDPQDMGIVIGKSGQTIKSIRRLLTIRAMTENVRVNLSLVEPEGSEKPNPENS
jgi:uncharacterized protein